MDSTGLRQLFLAMERADVLRTKKDFRHPYPGVFKVCESARFESSARGLGSAGESMPDLKTPENNRPEDMKCKSSGFVAE